MTPARDDRIGGPARPDARDPFQRDRDRILYSPAFRRLAGVTQVVSPSAGEVFHNRLTHTLKVAQVGRRIAERLLQIDGEHVAGWGGLTPDVVEAAGLAHDLGHPPFGHTAEEELDRLVSQAGGTGGFEGNAQSFRILTRLAIRRTDAHHSLDLTRATLNATLKYPAVWHAGCRKWGAFPTEQAEFEFARGAMPDWPHPCLEAQLMDWADDITYSVHDTEDFYRAGLLPLDRLAMADSERRSFLRAAHARWQTIGRTPPFAISRIEAVFMQLCDTLRISEPFRGTRSQSGSLNEFVSHTIHDLVENTRLLPFPGEGGVALAVPPEQRLRVLLLKELTWVYVIRNPALATHRRGQQHVVRTLFEVYDDAAKRKDWVLFPAQGQDEAEELVQQFSGEVPVVDRARLVADTIAALTDLQAVRLYQQLTGHALEGLLAPLGR